jgi:hypothetical protein
MDTLYPAPAESLIISYEDSAEHVIVPRLMAANANLNKIQIWKLDRSHLVLPEGLEVLIKATEQTSAKLIVIDPLAAALSSKIDSHKDTHIRQLLGQLAVLADKRRCTILIVRHLNKSGGSRAIYRGGGSIGIIGAARTGLLLDKDPDDEKVRILATTKCNLGREGEPLAVRLVPAESPGVGIEVAKVEWSKAGIGRGADELLADEDSRAEKYAQNEAETWLRSVLGDGPVLTNDVIRDSKQFGISERTLRRVKSKIQVISEKDTFNGKWRWRLP